VDAGESQSHVGTRETLADAGGAAKPDLAGDRPIPGEIRYSLYRGIYDQTQLLRVTRTGTYRILHGYEGSGGREDSQGPCCRNLLHEMRKAYAGDTDEHGDGAGNLLVKKKNSHEGSMIDEKVRRKSGIRVTKHQPEIPRNTGEPIRK